LDRIESLTTSVARGKGNTSSRKRDIIRFLEISEEQLSEAAHLYGANPYIEAFFTAKNEIFSPMLCHDDIRFILIGKLDKNKIYQKFLDSLCQYTSSPYFKNMLKGNRKSERERENEVSIITSMLF
jgi:hypothetical protein